METKPPLPPFTLETAKIKVQAAEDAWNTRDPERVALAYTEDSEWRNRAEFFSGRTAIKEFLSGQAETLMQVQSILTDAGMATIHHIGTVGLGMTIKLAVNALFGIQAAALAELLGMLSKNDISPEKAMECLGDLPVLSLAAKGAGSLIVSQNHAPLFPIALVEKDFRYVAQTAQSLKATIPTSNAVMDIYRSAIAQGHGNENITGIFQLFV